MKLQISLLILVTFQGSFGQNSSFSYQGRLTDGSSPASGSYDLEFRLYDAANAGTQIGAAQVRDNVAVSNGIFTVVLDFGRSPFTSTAAGYIETSVRPGASTGAYVLLSPRQPITSAPYAIKSGTADTASSATSADALGGIAAENYVVTTDPRMSDARTPLAGSANYIQNATVQQPLSSFNISGNGTAGGTLSAGTQFNIGTNRVLTVSGLNLTNTFAGVQAGESNTSGRFNSLFGNGAGRANASGENNSFFGSGAGNLNEIGSDNSFFGRNAGFASLSYGNSFFGSFAGAATTSGSMNTFIGRDAGRVNTEGFNNTLIGSFAGQNNTRGNGNTFVGASAGYQTDGDPKANQAGYNTFVGLNSGYGHVTGTFNTALGVNAGFGSPGIFGSTAIGQGARADQNHSVVLGSNASVGIGTNAPQAKLQVVGHYSVTGGGFPSGPSLQIDGGSNSVPNLTALRVVLGGSQPGTLASFASHGDFRVDAPNVPGGRFYITEDGKVGIGLSLNASPDKLAVNGTVSLLLAPGGGSTHLCTNGGNQIAACTSFAETSSTRVAELESRVREQSKEIEELRRSLNDLKVALCAAAPDVCKPR